MGSTLCAGLFFAISIEVASHPCYTVIGDEMSKKVVAVLTAAILVALSVMAIILYHELSVLPRREDERRATLFREYYEAKIDAYARENATLRKGEIDVVFLGDSLTDGCPLERWYPEYRTLNRGIGGDTTHGLLDRMQVSVYDVVPKVAVILIGGNNLRTMFEDYEEILKGLQGALPETDVVLVSLTAMRGTHREKNDLAVRNNLRIKDYAERYGYTYVDIYSVLYDEEEGALCASYAADDVHLNEAGYAAVTPLISAAIRTLLTD